MKSRRPAPLTQLALQFRVAAANIHLQAARAKAARDARLVPRQPVECNRNSPKGKAARLGRLILEHLPDMASDEQLAQAAIELRGCADILLMPPGARWDETRLGDRRRAA